MIKEILNNLPNKELLPTVNSILDLLHNSTTQAAAHEFNHPLNKYLFLVYDLKLQREFLNSIDELCNKTLELQNTIED